MIYIKHYTYDKLIAEGYEVSNMIIDDVSLSMQYDYRLTFCLMLNGRSFATEYGDYSLGKGYLGAPDNYFEGSAKGIEAVMRIMDVIGVDDLMKAKGHYVRVAHKKLSSDVMIIGNIIEDKWFDCGTFFSENAEDTSTENSDTDNTNTDYISKAKDLYARMQKWADEHNTENKDSLHKWYLYYDTDEWMTESCYISDDYYPFDIYFNTEEIAQQALAEFQSELNEIFIGGLWKQWLNDEERKV